MDLALLWVKGYVFEMGILRALLAIAVVAAHSGPIFGTRMTSGATSVEGFFIISGFYMAMILNEKYFGWSGIKKFYINRALRIHPLYWLSLVLLLICASLTNEVFLTASIESWKNLALPGAIWAALANIALFTQDLFFLFRVDSAGNLIYSQNLVYDKSAFFNQIINGPSWTLGLELTFYLVAPFIVPKTWKIVLCGLLSFVVYKVGKANGLIWDPWSYRFFPFELVLFCLGGLAFKFYRNYVVKMKLSRRTLFFVSAVPILTTVFFEQIPFWANEMKPWGYFLLLTATIPFLFEVTRELKWDTYIGEFSFPIYICHFQIPNIFKIFFGIDFSQHRTLYLITVILISWLLLQLVKPIERIRSRGFVPKAS